MTDKEIIQALRCCEKEVCADGGLCPLFSDADCIVHLGEAAIDLIERLTAANAELREKRRWIPVTERLPEERALVNVVWVNRAPEPYYKKNKGRSVFWYCVLLQREMVLGFSCSPRSVGSIRGR